MEVGEQNFLSLPTMQPLMYYDPTLALLSAYSAAVTTMMTPLGYPGYPGVFVCARLCPCTRHGTNPGPQAEQESWNPYGWCGGGGDPPFFRVADYSVEKNIFQGFWHRRTFFFTRCHGGQEVQVPVQPCTPLDVGFCFNSSNVSFNFASFSRYLKISDFFYPIKTAKKKHKTAFLGPSPLPLVILSLNDFSFKIDPKTLIFEIFDMFYFSSEEGVCPTPSSSGRRRRVPPLPQVRIGNDDRRLSP